MNGTRYHDPDFSSFTQPDTIIPNPTNGQSYNRYTYVNNNPINFNDPTGHDACKGGGGGCGGVRGGPVETPSRFYGQVHYGDLNGDGLLCEGSPSTCGDEFGGPISPGEPTIIGELGDLLVDDGGGPTRLGELLGTAGTSAAAELTGPVVGKYIEWGDGWIYVRSNGVVAYYPSSGATRAFRNLVVGQSGSAGSLRISNVVLGTPAIRRTFVVLGIVLDGHSNLDRFSDGPLPEQLGLAFGRTAAQGGGTALGSMGGGMAGGAVGSAFCGPGAPVCFGAFVVGGTIIGGVAGHETGAYFFDLATGGAG